MNNPTLNRGGVAVGEMVGTEFRAAAHRLGKPKSSGTIARHVNGSRLPTYEWRKLYERHFGINPDHFDQKPTREQLKKLGA